MSSVRLPKSAFVHALSSALTGALESGDLSKMEAVHTIMTKEGFSPREFEEVGESPFKRMLKVIERDHADFVMVAAPGFSRELKLATGRSRDEWAALLT